MTQMSLLSRIADHLKAVFNSYSEVFFLQGSIPGIIILAVTFINPHAALAGILSVTAAYIFAWFIGMNREYLKSGFNTYNPLLVGLSIGYLFEITPLTLFFIVAAGIFAFVLTAMINSLFSLYLGLPILSVPFVFISSIAYLSSSRYSNLFVNGLFSDPVISLEHSFPLWLAGFFKCLGAVLFMPYVPAGMVIACMILFSSRILFMLAAAGYYSGTLITALLVGSFYQAFSDINHFNYILIAMAVGGIFLVPSVKSYALARDQTNSPSYDF